MLYTVQLAVTLKMIAGQLAIENTSKPVTKPDTVQ